MYWEMHITLDVGPVSSRALVEALNWKFSCINGDPDLGVGPREYATRHASCGTDIEVVKSDLNYTAMILKDYGHKVTRRKIELVMYDTKGKEK